MGLATLLWPNKPQGFFTPYRFASLVREREASLQYSHCDELFAAHLPDFLAVLEGVDPFQSALEAIGTESPPAPRWDQDWFSGLDAVVAYSLVRQQPPSLLIEVGAGHSTRFFAQARRDSGKEFKIVTIDPHPRGRLGGLDVDHIHQDVTQAPQEIWDDIVPNDIVSMDSSHILQPGTDVDYFLNQVLPSLSVGTRLHVHDIFLPNPYPAPWRWRGYNEQTAIAALLGTGAYRPIFASHYITLRHKQLLDTSPAAPFAELGGAPASSLWLEKVR